MPYKDPAVRKKYQQDWHKKRDGYSTTYNQRRRKELGPDAVREYTRKQTRSWTIRIRHGLTLEEYAGMLERQGNKCATCGSDSPGTKHDWHIDHCHATGAVRGLLCHRCNVSLGLLKDNKQTLFNMIKYLGG